MVHMSRPRSRAGFVFMSRYFGIIPVVQTLLVESVSQSWRVLSRDLHVNGVKMPILRTEQGAEI